jgi:hypothetical protein
MDKNEALKLALEALERYQIKRQDFDIFVEAITAIKEALAQPAQEPMHPDIKKMYEDYFDKCFRESSAAQRPWVGLTSKELNEIFAVAMTGEHAVRLALDKVKEKNT